MIIGKTSLNSFLDTQVVVKRTLTDVGVTDVGVTEVGVTHPVELETNLEQKQSRPATATAAAAMSRASLQLLSISVTTLNFVTFEAVKHFKDHNQGPFSRQLNRPQKFPLNCMMSKNILTNVQLSIFWSFFGYFKLFGKFFAICLKVSIAWSKNFLILLKIKSSKRKPNRSNNRHLTVLTFCCSTSIIIKNH